MRYLTVLFGVAAMLFTAQAASAALIELPDPVITASTSAYDSSFAVANLFDDVFDGSAGSMYVTSGKGVDTFVDFDFGAATIIAGFKHIERTTSSSGQTHFVEAADLIFSNDPSFATIVDTIAIDHVATPLGETYVEFDSPVTARYVRWDVTALLNPSWTFVGGSEMAFYTIPEPATMCLLAVGGGLLVCRRRKHG